ncbi:MAG: UvrD-helicase domain-containing protein, partial [Patescibacteria group bacterium]
MNDFQEQYKMLNDGQRKAVDTLEGPVIVIAGPGTGKTQILTLRIANILKQTGDDIGPENILALTFTNAGVVAMRERLATFVGAEEAYRTNIYSFHSFCEEQIGLHSDYFSSIIYSRVASDVEKIHIVEDILENNDFETLKTFASSFHYIRDILSAIDDLKREGVSPSDFVVKIKLQEEGILVDPDSYYKRNTKKNKKGDLKPDALKHVVKNRELQKVYELYQEKLKEKKLYDFTDMIMQFVEVAENNEELGSILREQYRYLLVDEHQDTNEGQNRIIDVIASSKHLGSDPNLFTVGDDKQAIYRFQGANVESFMNFG